MLKLEINVENPKEEPKVNFIFAEEGKLVRFGAGWARVKLTSPSDFDGNQEKCRAFLNTCHIYFSICRDSFKGDEAHRHWALSVFKSDQVACLANKVMHLEKRSGKWHYKDWHAFESEFRELFCTKKTNNLWFSLKLREWAGTKGKTQLHRHICWASWIHRVFRWQDHSH